MADMENFAPVSRLQVSGKVANISFENLCTKMLFLQALLLKIRSVNP
eukprot:CAMPEP_0183749498 /NCGR_PEP_ID=MMETSP0737-20130205/68316_1 /TAXON_ID=385413 /ORGANISM="Thalassiosira miniscula, Strain CCMP1093" /LENGTH=46 /DNA_ID= /DNA_START= /DNA_END= /DNA_ORIENTATION=